jgi:lipopolysaccharide transport system ATP-binding protein
MSSSPVVQIHQVSKHYQIYKAPKDRLRQTINFRISRKLGLPAKQYFHSFFALQDVSFSVGRGERVGIIGKNGSGKSTLLQILCGTLTPTGGAVEVMGRVAALLELGSGFNAEFSGRENIYINASVLGLRRSEIDERLDRIIEFADIGEFIDQPVKTYSSGMFVRLAFSVIAHVDADLLIIDEALAVGDAFFNQKCMRFLDDFSKHGTIILVTHDTSAVTSFCTRAIWLDHGRLVADGDTKAVSEKYLASIYGTNASASPMSIEKLVSQEEHVFWDSRLAFLNHSNLRNDLEVFRFNPDSSKFGTGAGVITNVLLRSEDARPMTWAVGGEIVTIEMTSQISVDVVNAVSGFLVKDRLGKILFGDNTFHYCQYPKAQFRAGEQITTQFRFRMPILPVGDYVVSVALADGNLDNHQMLCWMHDALAFKSVSTSVSTGLVGIPMLDVKLY